MIWRLVRNLRLETVTSPLGHVTYGSEILAFLWPDKTRTAANACQKPFGNPSQTGYLAFLCSAQFWAETPEASWTLFRTHYSRLGKEQRICKISSATFGAG